MGFTRVLYLIEDACDWAWRGPEWLRPAVGGLVLGLVLLALPEMYGVGYPVLEKATEGGYAVGFLLLLAGRQDAGDQPDHRHRRLGRGVRAQPVHRRDARRRLRRRSSHDLLPGTAGAVGAYALVGMGAVFAGAARAPITAVVILFELTGEYSIILPLMLAIVLATVTSRLLSRDTIYTLKLRRRGIDLEGPARGAQIGAQQRRRRHGTPALATARVDGTRRRRRPAEPVRPRRASGRRRPPASYVGVVTAQAVAEALAEQPEAAPTRVGQLAEPPATRHDGPAPRAGSARPALGSGNRGAGPGSRARQAGRLAQPPERAARGAHRRVNRPQRRAPNRYIALCKNGYW